MSIRGILKGALLGAVALAGIASMSGTDIARADKLDYGSVRYIHLFNNTGLGNNEFGGYLGFEGIAGYQTVVGLNPGAAWETYKAFGTPSFNKQPRRVRYGVSTGASQQVRAVVRCCKATNLNSCIDRYVGSENYDWTAPGGYKDNSTTCTSSEVAMKMRLGQATQYCGNTGNESNCKKLY